MAGDVIDSILRDLRFSDPEAWEERGLNPSQESVVNLMQTAASRFLLELKQLWPVSEEPVSPDIHARVQSLVEGLPWDDLDTEEREFLADVLAPAIQGLGLNPWAMF
jgi:hypothetical protein